ncbi:MAG: peptidoglycan-binding protein [Pyrinomonadaceae bacterium]|nr:peptidoglycan-binding protein [Pyrinomonadaceae bacterium]
MKKFILILFIFILSGISINAQKPDGKQVFRANKDQLIMAQKMLKVEPTGKPDVATRTAIKTFQTEKSLKETGDLDRDTLKKLGIGLTNAQRQMSAPPDEKTAAGDVPKPKTAGFRATKEQIIQVQNLLKKDGFYSGEATGIVNPATGEGLKKYQAANDLEATGTVNQITLEKMDITVTAQQMEDSKSGSE